MDILNKMREKPFCLNDEQVDRVEETFKSLDLKSKVGQLFCHLHLSGKPISSAGCTDD